MTLEGRIVVTGHTGVVGSRLHQRLSDRGTPLVLVNSRGVFVQDPGQEPEVVTDDVFERSALAALMHGAKSCVHLAAAQSGAVTEDVVGALLRNALITDYFAGLAAEAGIASFVYASSGAVYFQFADPSLKSIDEDTPIHAAETMVDEVMDYVRGLRRTRDYGAAYRSASEGLGLRPAVSAISSRAGYAFSKRMGEISSAEVLPERQRLTLRLANVFGPGDRGDRIIPKFIRTARTGGIASVFDWSRNFIWIDDLLEIIEKAIDGARTPTGILNAITPGNTMTLWDLSQVINSVVDGPGGEFVLRRENHEPHFSIQTRYPSLLPRSPVTLREGLFRLLDG